MFPPSMPARAPRVAIVTVSYGSRRVLQQFLASIPKEGSESATLTIVADNMRENEVEQLVHTFDYAYLPLDNPGYGGAVNAAVAGLPNSVRWILISNPDVVLESNTLETLVAVGEQDRRIGAIGPLVRNEDGTIYPSARAVPSLRTGIGHALFAEVWQRNPWTRSYRSEQLASDIQRDAGWLSGSCLLVRRDLFDQLGGFDEGYFMYFEDVDLGFRIGKAGYRNVFAPDAKVTHIGAHSTGAHSETMIDAHHASARRFLAKKYSGPLLSPVRWILTAGLSARSRLLKRRAGR